MEKNRLYFHFLFFLILIPHFNLKAGSLEIRRKSGASHSSTKKGGPTAYRPASSSSSVSHTLGPSLSLQIPHPLFLDIERRFGTGFSAALGLGGLALSVTSNGVPVSASIGGADIRGRWHPFHGAFFLGTAFGIQKMAAKTSDSFSANVQGQSISLNVAASVQIISLYFTPHLGWIWFFENGLLLGVELGWQITFGASTSIEPSTDNALGIAALSGIESTARYQQLQTEAKNVGNKLGNQSLPYLALLRVGWLF